MLHQCHGPSKKNFLHLLHFFLADGILSSRPQFLEGLFQNISHAKDFVKFDPIPILLDLVALKSTPSLGTTSPAFSSLTAVFRILSDIKAAEVAVQLLKKIDSMLEETKDLWEKEELEPKLGAFSVTSASFSAALSGQ